MFPHGRHIVSQGPGGSSKLQRPIVAPGPRWRSPLGDYHIALFYSTDLQGPKNIQLPNLQQSQHEWQGEKVLLVSEFCNGAVCQHQCVMEPELECLRAMAPAHNFPPWTSMKSNEIETPKKKRLIADCVADCAPSPQNTGPSTVRHSLSVFSRQ